MILKIIQIWLGYKYVYLKVILSLLVSGNAASDKDHHDYSSDKRSPIKTVSVIDYNETSSQRYAIATPIISNPVTGGQLSNAAVAPLAEGYSPPPAILSAAQSDLSNVTIMPDNDAGGTYASIVTDVPVPLKTINAEAAPLKNEANDSAPAAQQTVTQATPALNTGLVYLGGLASVGLPPATNSAVLQPSVTTAEQPVVPKINKPPAFDSISGENIITGNSAFKIIINANDSDAWPSPLKYSALSIPSGANFDPDTHTFSWTPTYKQNGIYSVTFTAFDGMDTASQTVSIAVNNANRAPVLDPIGDKAVTEGSLLTFTLSASDPDGDAITYSATGLPQGAIFNAATRIFTWTPTYRQAGIYHVKFTASDGTLTHSETITVTSDFIDTDADGMPDTWEIENFGNLNQNAQDDFDKDGLTDIEEYKSGTDPKVTNENIALGKTYVMDPAPNYWLTIDSYRADPDDGLNADRALHKDATDLTDGQHADGAGIWCGYPETVGWEYYKYAIMTFDLGSDQSIAAVKFYSAGQLDNVAWPQHIMVMVSNDNTNFYMVSDMVRDSPPPVLPPSAPGFDNRIKYTFVSTGLNTHGRYVKIFVMPEAFTFVDEVEVFTGGGNKPYSGTPFPAGRNAPMNMVKLIARLRMDLDIVRSRAEASGLDLNADINDISSRIDNFNDFTGIDNIRTVMPQNFGTLAGQIQADILKLNSAVLRDSDLSGSIIWPGNRWDPIDPYTVPPAVRTLGSMHLYMMNGEKRGSVINITNADDLAKSIKINISGFGGADNPDWMKIYKVQSTDTADNLVISDMLVELTKEPGGYSIDIPSGMTQQVWIDYKPAGLGAGDNLGSVAINDGAISENIPVTLTISKYALPEKLSLHFGEWDYADRALVASQSDRQITPTNIASVKELMDKYQYDMPWDTPVVVGRCDMRSRNFESGNNFIPRSGYFEYFDSWIANFPNAYQYCIFIFADENGGFAYNNTTGTYAVNIFTETAKFNAMIASWMAAWEDHLVSRGIEPDRAVFLIIDEPGTVQRERATIMWGKALRDRPKKYNSHIQIFEDTSGLEGKPYESTVIDGDDVYSVSDILCPLESIFIPGKDPNRGFEFFEDQRVNKGKRLMFYSCSFGREGDPYALNLIREWLIYKYHGEAVKYWSLGDAGGVADLNEYAASGKVYSPLYFDGPIVYSSKRWEAIFEGRQDYEYFNILKMFVEYLKEKHPDHVDAILDAESAISTAIDAVTSEVLNSDSVSTYTRYVSWVQEKDRSIADIQRNSVWNKINDLSNIYNITLLYKIKVSAGPGGAISPSGSDYYAPDRFLILANGECQTFTITPNPGYGIKDVMVDGVSVGPVNNYTFTGVTSGHTIAATFSIAVPETP